METYELDLGLVLSVLRRRLALILLSALICAGAAFFISSYAMTPNYTATVKMYVYSDPTRDASMSTITQTELTASQSLVATYLVILESDTVLDSVIQKLNLNCDTEYLRELIDASAINDTEVFSVSVTYTNPRTAQIVANTLAEVAPEEIIRVVKAGGVEVVDYAKIPEKPSSPNVVNYTVIGALLGFFLSFALYLLLAMLDTKIRDEEDLTKVFDVPVLGTIPAFGTVVTGDGKEGSGNAKKKK